MERLATWFFLILWFYTRLEVLWVGNSVLHGPRCFIVTYSIDTEWTKCKMYPQKNLNSELKKNEMTLSILPKRNPKEIGSRCESRGYQIVPNGPIWLGESVFLRVKIPNMKRPIFWQSENFTLDCNTTCTKSNDYRVSQEHDHSYLWIRNVSWEFSNWFFYEGNHKFGHISLDINVKPKIAIKSTSTGYKLMAVCSLPTTVIECYQGKKPLTFTEASQSNCSDGRTFSNIGTLSFSEFCGNVSCQFSTGNIFREYRMWHFESEEFSTRIVSAEYILLLASCALFIEAIIVCYFLFKKFMRKMRILKRRNGEHSSARNLTTEVVLRFVFFVLLFATGIPVSIGCQMRKEKSLKCEDSLLSICTANTFFWVLTILLFIAWIIVSFSLIIIGNQLETLKVEDRLKGTSTTAIVISRVFLPELILLIMPFTYRCRKCEKGEECLSGFCITAILLFCGSILHIAWVIIRIYLWKQSQTPKREKGKRCRLRTHSLNILSKVVRKNLLASNLRNYRSSEHRTTSGQQ